jgi:hypothetical protein
LRRRPVCAVQAARPSSRAPIGKDAARAAMRRNSMHKSGIRSGIVLFK